MNSDQPAHPRSLIMIHAVRLQILLQVIIGKLIANSMDPDQTARIYKCRRLIEYVFLKTKIILIFERTHRRFD
jgi:hypothetical protein